MNSSTFRPSDLISVIAFLHIFKIACDNNRIYEEAEMWTFFHFTTEPVKTALSHRKSATEDNTSHKEGALKVYCRSVNYLLETNATDDVIAEA